MRSLNMNSAGAAKPRARPQYHDPHWSPHTTGTAADCRLPQCAEADTMWRLLYHAYPSRSLDFTVRCRDVSDGRLGGHSGEAVVECDVERWGSEALYTS